MLLALIEHLSQTIAEKAKELGYSVVKFGSTKGEGNNYAVIKDWEKILWPNLPVK